MNAEAAKYSRIEYARRFLVAPSSDWKNFVEPYSKRHEDKYIENSRLRLRILTDSDSSRQIIKLTKKYESESPYFRQINTIILSPTVYQIFDTLEGNRVAKTRYYHYYQNRTFSIDVFENKLAGLIICETEQPDLENLMSAVPPRYISHEVTEESFFTGANLSQVTNVELIRRLSSLL